VFCWCSLAPPCCALLLFINIPFLCFVIHWCPFMCSINARCVLLMLADVPFLCFVSVHWCYFVVLYYVHWHPCCVLLVLISTPFVICWCSLVLPCWALLVLIGAPLPHFVDVCGAPLLRSLGIPHCPLVVHQHILLCYIGACWHLLDVLCWCWLVPFLLCSVGVFQHLLQL
jgi:hypothetical protein